MQIFVWFHTFDEAHPSVPRAVNGDTGCRRTTLFSVICAVHAVPWSPSCVVYSPARSCCRCDVHDVTQPFIPFPLCLTSSQYHETISPSRHVTSFMDDPYHRLYQWYWVWYCQNYGCLLCILCRWKFIWGEGQSW